VALMLVTSRETYLSRAARCVVRKYMPANACHLMCDVVCLTKRHATEVAAHLHTSSCSHYARDGKPLAPVPSLATIDISGRTSCLRTHLQVKYTFRPFIKHK
jgi:hypothetical protein